MNAYRYAFDLGFHQGWDAREAGAPPDRYPLAALPGERRQRLLDDLEERAEHQEHTVAALMKSYEEGYFAAFGQTPTLGTSTPQINTYLVGLYVEIEVAAHDTQEAFRNAEHIAKLVGPVHVRARTVKQQKENP